MLIDIYALIETRFNLYIFRSTNEQELDAFNAVAFCTALA